MFLQSYAQSHPMFILLMLSYTIELKQPGL
jgi:hypothetical protein